MSKDRKIISLTEYRRSLANHTELNANAILYTLIGVALEMESKLDEQAKEIENLNRRLIKMSTMFVSLGGKLDG